MSENYTEYKIAIHALISRTQANPYAPAWSFDEEWRDLQPDDHTFPCLHVYKKQGYCRAGCILLDKDRKPVAFLWPEDEDHAELLPDIPKAWKDKKHEFEPCYWYPKCSPYEVGRWWTENGYDFGQNQNIEIPEEEDEWDDEDELNDGLYDGTMVDTVPDPGDPA